MVIEFQSGYTACLLCFFLCMYGSTDRVPCSWMVANKYDTRQCADTKIHMSCFACVHRCDTTVCWRRLNKVFGGNRKGLALNAWTMSPRADAIQLLPVPYTSRALGFAVFPVIGFDPSLKTKDGQFGAKLGNVIFRFADKEEQGAISEICLPSNYTSCQAQFCTLLNGCISYWQPSNRGLVFLNKMETFLAPETPDLWLRVCGFWSFLLSHDKRVCFVVLCCLLMCPAAGASNSALLLLPACAAWHVFWRHGAKVIFIVVSVALVNIRIFMNGVALFTTAYKVGRIYGTPARFKVRPKLSEPFSSWVACYLVGGAPVLKSK